MNSSKTLVSILAATVLIAGLAACQKKEDVAGPAETAGQKIDQAATTAGQKIDEATTKVGQEADKAKAEASQSVANMQDATGKKLEEIGQKMQEAPKDK
ncbi:hypothetical protein [Herminiimonas fonticola]|uniref:Late embryogenesis abundant protein n=1 Tax=Herminiimonas fonticola TaxID=303380 RepID=A0A4V3BWI0_9BURK|nr:hypothetical protein [Herminiimonas fonticola]RBA25597.1 hypothetical protein Hfont_1230 [Herminiimonas fonticola]TDN94708.1 hypothetical protein EV677_1263 [Herminiimonas fonticola]